MSPRNKEENTHILLSFLNYKQYFINPVTDG